MMGFVCEPFFTLLNWPASLGSSIDIIMVKPDADPPFHASSPQTHFPAAEGEAWGLLSPHRAGQTEEKLNHPWKSHHLLKSLMTFVPNVSKILGSV